jgi:hypothetical protein
MEELSNFDIQEIAPIFKINLICCIDFHDILHYPFADGSYILNMANKHWTCLFIKDSKGVYFDSYGVIYPNEVKMFCPKIIYSDDTIQSIGSVACGYYCLYFLYWMTNKYKYNLESTLNNFRAQFNDDESVNDKILQKCIKKLCKP